MICLNHLEASDWWQTAPRQEFWPWRRSLKKVSRMPGATYRNQRRTGRDVPGLLMTSTMLKRHGGLVPTTKKSNQNDLLPPAVPYCHDHCLKDLRCPMKQIPALWTMWYDDISVNELLLTRENMLDWMQLEMYIQVILFVPFSEGGKCKDYCVVNFKCRNGL